jgi:hypothetical protein
MSLGRTVVSKVALPEEEDWSGGEAEPKVWGLYGGFFAGRERKCD